MDNKAKIKVGAAVVIGAIVVWQVVGLFGGGSEATQTADAKPQTRPNPDIPKKAPLLTEQAQPKMAVSDREMQLMQMQQDTETKYIAALEQLQLLLVEKDIANANKDIANANKDIIKAKKDSIFAQKDILNSLAPPPTKTTAATVDGGPTPMAVSKGPGVAASPGSENDYSVVSVSFTRGRWVAVLASAAGKLYSVGVGDTLTEDGSIVKSIGRSGVTLDKSGAPRKIPMVSII